jgi:hypothetical protein
MQFFKGVDRAKYDIGDRSVWIAMQRDRMLHEEAVRAVQRHLYSASAAQAHQKRTPRLALPLLMQPRQTGELPEELHDFGALMNQTRDAIAAQSIATQLK